MQVPQTQGHPTLSPQLEVGAAGEGQGSGRRGGKPRSQEGRPGVGVGALGRVVARRRRGARPPCEQEDAPTPGPRT